MRDEIVFVIEDSPEGGYEAHAFGYSIYTYAATLGKLQQMADDAIKCHFGEEERPARVILQRGEDY